MEQPVATYLFAWNPDQGRPHTLAPHIEAVSRAGKTAIGWRSGKRRSLPAGSRIFLIRLGVEPRGIICAGVSVTEPHGSPPWLDIEFDSLRETPAIPLHELLQPPFSTFHWSIQGSGVELPKEVAAALNALWRRRTALPTMDLGEEIIPAGTLPEGSVRTIKVNAYERNPTARAACVAHYGAACAVCGLDFGRFYGPELSGVVHVHHLKPLATIGRAHEVDAIRDLRPVCPNCHAAIHSQDPPLGIDDVKRRVRRYGSRGA
jgi:5-methylcytosine-specific restriction protein A